MHGVWIDWLRCLIIKLLILSLFNVLQGEKMSVNINILILGLMEGPQQYNHQYSYQLHSRINIFIVLMVLPSNIINAFHCSESSLSCYTYICDAIVIINYKLSSKYTFICFYLGLASEQPSKHLCSILISYRSCKLGRKKHACG